MTEVIQVQSSSRSSIQSSPTRNDGLYQLITHLSPTLINTDSLSPVALDLEGEEEELLVGGGERKRRREEEEERERGYNQLNLVGLFFTAFRRSVLGCSSCEGRFSAASCSSGGMEIGLPTNVRHVAHVTFDRFNGFLGLPVEFEPEVSRRAPSASTTVFGVSTNSMQLSFDTRGNSVPTILLLMQHRLYALGGLQAEGIFRINPDNGQEEHVRDQLNQGLVPEDVDVHCLAGLIKAWFRELPTGVLDCLPPEQVLQSQTEEDCSQLARLLPPTEASLLDWAINLMADVAQFEHLNKMNARNVAMVFAPNMTHMADPLTALMHAVQVMNFLKMLIEKTLREREDAALDSALDESSRRDPSGGNAQHPPLQTIREDTIERSDYDEDDVEAAHCKAVDPPAEDQSGHIDPDASSISSHHQDNDESLASEAKDIKDDNSSAKKPCKTKTVRNGQPSRKGSKKANERPTVSKPLEKNKGTSLINSVSLRTERVEAWR